MGFTSHKKEVLDEVNRRIEKALTACGLVAESYAEDYSKPRDTGTLANSITSKVVNDGGGYVMYVGTNTEYAYYVETGTGIYVPGGRQTPWAYKDEKNKWHLTRGIKPRHFLKKSLSEHKEKYRKMILDELKG